MSEKFSKNYYQAINEGRTRKRSALLLGALVVLLLSVLAALQAVGLWEVFTPERAAETVSFYALSSLTFVAFIIFAFIFLRSLYKLRRERAVRQLGSKIKTRLVINFIAISLLPLTAMTVFSYLFLNRSLEKWFGKLPADVVSEARAARSLEGATSVSETASVIAAMIVEQPQLADAESFDRFIKSGNLTALEIVKSDGEATLERTIYDLDSAPTDMKPDADKRAEATATLKRAREALKQGAERSVDCGETFCAATVKLSDGARYLVALRERNPHLARIVSSAESFDHLRRRQQRTRAIGISTIALLTLLSLFASLWIALHLARSIATPIRALAEAAHEVAEGNLQHRVTAIADDELALLAASFNDMTAQLAENRQRLEANARELQQKNLALAERRDYIETVLESVSNGVISLDARDRVTTINKAALEMLRLVRAPAAVTEFSEIVSEEDYAALAPIVRRARRAGRAAGQIELHRKANHGNIDSDEASARAAESVAAIPVAVNATAFASERACGESHAVHRAGEDSSAHEGRGVVLVIEDLTELLAAQRAAAWSEVARRMAHEIKNPLTPIQLSAERIARNFAKLRNGKEASGGRANGNAASAKGDLMNGDVHATDVETVRRVVEECTETIAREVAGLKGMVDEFARFARLPAPKFEPADLNDVVRQALALYQDRLGDVRLDVRLAPELPAVSLDAEQMRRVIVNLMDNALEAFDERSINGKARNGNNVERRITVATGFDSSRSRALIEITDTGHGIKPQDLQKLFQPYFTTRGRGTGLGLAIVKRIITDHDGSIRATQNHPRGAKFIVELPISSQ